MYARGVKWSENDFSRNSFIISMNSNILNIVLSYSSEKNETDILISMIGNSEKVTELHFCENAMKASKFLNLRVLKLSQFEMVLSPLRELKFIQALDMKYFGRDVSHLSQMTLMKELNIRLFNGDLSPLSGMKNMTSLNIGCFNMKDISPLSEMKNMTSLNLYSFNGDIHLFLE